jgi:hypothetical protein
MEEKRGRTTLWMLALFFVTLAVTTVLKPFPQWDSYHHFADGRTMWGIANFENVVSNLAFLIAGVYGIVFMLKPEVRSLKRAFTDSAHWWPYLVFFIGGTGIFFGSSYYHSAPANTRLLWDRLPMSVMFMGLLSAVIAERISSPAGKILTAPLVLLGLASVVGWWLSEQRGAGDLRMYMLVQFYPLLIMPLILYLFPARYTHTSTLIGSMLFYLAAKAMEQWDWPVYHVIGVSGHTIKHILSGFSVGWVVRYLRLRTPITSLASNKTPDLVANS